MAANLGRHSDTVIAFEGLRARQHQGGLQGRSHGLEALAGNQLLKSRQTNRGKHGHNGNHHHQLDKGETVLFGMRHSQITRHHLSLGVLVPVLFKVKFPSDNCEPMASAVMVNVVPDTAMLTV